jgi:hypothetical protein
VIEIACKTRHDPLGRFPPRQVLRTRIVGFAKRAKIAYRTRHDPVRHAAGVVHDLVKSERKAALAQGASRSVLFLTAPLIRSAVFGSAMNKGGIPIRHAYWACGYFVALTVSK